MLPLYLYKYLPFNDRSVNIIKNNELFFANPSEFNDPYDTRIIIDITGTDEQYEESFYQRVKLTPDYQYLTDQQMRTLAKAAVGEKNRDSEFRQNAGKIHAEKAASSVGVCCFSSKNDDLTMWAYYADHNRGICLQFLKEKDFFTKAFPVNYAIEYPKVNIFSSIIEKIDKCLLTKSKHWEHEAEYRIIIDGFRGNKKFPPQHLVGIILGCRIEQDKILKIKELIKSRDHPIKLYQAKLKEAKFGLDIDDIIVEY